MAVEEVAPRRPFFLSFTKKPKQDPTTFYTKGEELCNALTHGVGSLLAVVGTTLLVTLSALYGTARGVGISLIYGATLIILYTMSTLYHAFRQEKVKRLFRVFDHCTIYLLIAGSYTPFTLVLLPGMKGVVICSVIWALALLGIVLNSVSVERFAGVSMILYVVLGWAALWAISDIAHALPKAGFWLLLIGGVCYTGGIVFYALRKRYMHSIWHVFVLVGSVLHFLCILWYVMPQMYVR